MASPPIGSRDTSSADRLASAVTRWRDDLFDLGGRNTLLFYKDLRVGTLDLADTDPAAQRRFLGGARVQLSDLFPGADQHQAALKRAKTIYKKAREFQEERGVRVGYLAVGMASWDDETKKPAAPVLLRGMELVPASARLDDFTLAPDEEAEVNPALLHLLATQFAVRVQQDEFADLLTAQGISDPAPVFARLEALARGVSGFAVTDRLVVGTFSYAKLPMVRDLENATALLASSEIAAALAGDLAALRGVRGDALEGAVPSVDTMPLADEYLVLDADSSQSFAINSVVAGRNLVIDGPPGTGKSQTIANLIATLMARGQRVLFVAEKRAAIEAVLRRLKGVGLGDLVMDVHDGATNRRRIARELGETLERAGRTPAVDANRLHRNLDGERRRLYSHVETMHGRREPWGISAFEAQGALIGLRDTPSAARFTGAALRGLSGEALDDTRIRLREYTDLGAFAPNGRSLWKDALLRTGEEARQAVAAVQLLHAGTLPRAAHALDQLLAEVGLRRPANLDEWRLTLDIVDAVNATLAVLEPEVYEADLDRLVAATASGGRRRALGVKVSFGDRRRLRKQARALALEEMPKKALHWALAAAKEQQDGWSAMRVDSASPRLSRGLPAAADAFRALLSELDSVAPSVQAVPLPALPIDGLAEALARLAADQVTPYKIPKLTELRGLLNRAGLTPLLHEFGGRDPDGERAVAMFDYAWNRSILDAIGVDDTNYGAFEGKALDSVVAEFRTHDRVHIGGNAQRVRRATAERLYAVHDRYPDQEMQVRKQAKLSRKHMPVRQLFQTAPETLLALKPVWAMSPLVVSQVLPADRLFDVVIFDEASQIPVADAVPSLMRGNRTVVAGDPRQLPPTSFFAAAAEEEPDSGEPADLSFATGFESILDALQPVLRARSLIWHYRSRNERLISFSNAWIYDGSLTTFPGANEDAAVRHVLVPHTPMPGQEKSVTAEVHEVVQQIIEHAENRPHESLGVITMGIEHAGRIENALERAREARRDLDAFFSTDCAEPFFAKNLERVQGDERDAIILSLGYGKGADGRMRHHFGPLNQKGGERRLNVAVTRAKRRITLVSSFSSHDLDPNRLNAEGAKLLRAYLEFAASGGTELGAALEDKPPLNPFEIDVRNRLTAAGVPLTCQYGVAGYRIDFAAAHPERPGQMVLAIEADGATYHSSESARDRDRLRQQQLENLGWTFHRIWSTDWFRDPAREVAKARAAYEHAVALADELVEHGSEPGASKPAVVAGPAVPAPQEAVAQRALPRPRVWPGQPITAYTRPELVRLLRWIESDGLLRTEDDLIREAMAELGFRRRGIRIETALREAIKIHRR